MVLEQEVPSQNPNLSFEKIQRLPFEQKRVVYDSISPVLFKTLDRGNDDEKWQALFMLGGLSDPRAIPRLIKFVQELPAGESNPETAVIYALEWIITPHSSVPE